MKRLALSLVLFASLAFAAAPALAHGHHGLGGAGFHHGSYGYGRQGMYGYGMMPLNGVGVGMMPLNGVGVGMMPMTGVGVGMMPMAGVGMGMMPFNGRGAVNMRLRAPVYNYGLGFGAGF